jgi:uncharacterized membrane protein YoaK (UPF0700 family)
LEDAMTTNTIVVTLIVAACSAFIGAYFAKYKGRSIALWGTLAFFFPLIALLVLAVLPSKTPVQPA